MLLPYFPQIVLLVGNCPEASSPFSQKSGAISTETRGKNINAKPLHGFGGAAVLEIVASKMGDTFRAIYTVKFTTAIYVLHAFKRNRKAGLRLQLKT